MIFKGFFQKFSGIFGRWRNHLRIFSIIKGIINIIKPPINIKPTGIKPVKITIKRAIKMTIKIELKNSIGRVYRHYVAKMQHFYSIKLRVF